LASDLLQKLKIDDPVEAFAVHGAGGIWGCLAVPLCDINFVSGVGGDLFGPGIPIGQSLQAQVAGIVTIILWSGILSFVMFSIIKAVGLLRVDEHHEEIGIDAAEFSPKNAYNQKKDHFDVGNKTTGSI
jgi:Amt family ammonium transporter